MMEESLDLESFQEATEMCPETMMGKISGTATDSEFDLSLVDVDEKQVSSKYEGSGPDIRVADVMTPTPSGALYSNAQLPPPSKVHTMNLEMVNRFKKAYNQIVHEPVKKKYKKS